MREYFTPEEVAEQLKVTRRSVYRWLHGGKLRGLRAGGLWRICEEDIEAFLKGETTMADDKERRV